MLIYFKKVAYITFYNNQRMKRVFDEDYDIERILVNINIEAHTEVTPEDTLIILDEIQEAPRALEALKYFCENAPEYAVVAAGSLLGVAIHAGVSFPVGKVDMLELHPMNFREFLEAMGEVRLSELLAEKKYSLIDDFRGKYIFWLKNYYYVAECRKLSSILASIRIMMKCAACRIQFWNSMKMISVSIRVPAHFRECVWFGIPYLCSLQKKIKSSFLEKSEKGPEQKISNLLLSGFRIVV